MIDLNGDDPLDPAARKRLIAGIAGDPNDLQHPLPVGGATELPPSAAPSPLSSDALVAGAPRRGGGTGGTASGALSGASTGSSIGSFVPGLGTLAGGAIGALIGGIGGAITKHAASAPTDFLVDDARNAIAARVKETGGPEDVDTILRGQGWKPGDRYVGQAGLEGVFRNLDANAAKRAAGAAPAAAVPTTTPATGATKSGLTADAPPLPGDDRVQPSSGSMTLGTTGAPDYGRTVGQYVGPQYFGSYDEAKFNDPTHDSPKYQTLRALSHFDPSKGVTPEVIAALNSLNLGTFSGSGDKVTLANADPRWDGMTGADLITDFGPGGKNQWGVGGQFPGDATALGASGQTGAGAFGYLDPALSGDPMKNIQDALAQVQRPGTIQDLIRQIQGR